MYFNKANWPSVFRETNILPAKDAWEHPAFDEPRAYWSGKSWGGYTPTCAGRRAAAVRQSVY